MKQYLEAFLNLIFPPPQECPLCGGFSPGEKVCPACEAWLALQQKGKYCCRCGRPVAGEALCGDCMERDWPFELARSVGPYSGPLREGVHRFKYGGRRRLALPLGALMARRVMKHPTYRQAGLVVPVPMTPARLRRRGYNQALLLARSVSAELGIGVEEVLKKTADTVPQTVLRRSEREQNLRGAFVLQNNPSLWGKTVLLIDDIITTGSTASAAAAVLRQGGAKKVLVLTLAATPKSSKKLRISDKNHAN
ncbi:ComF family protein [Desulfofalx alkaliphila]|uniref:ComF family protein n=1 Tax=Desulfofalx alkaliphila TaxID=105483 RepID=UPI0004E14C38|nr:ComF family protein [Desulfofalx alkaliphila]